MYDLFDLTLSDGKVMKGCKWLKKSNKKNVVIVTGMAESSYRYDEFALFLNSKGFNVYCIDHYGQGLNAETEDQCGVWPKDGFLKAVEMVHEEVEFIKSSTKKPVYLFSHSMGSFVSQEFIQLYGDSIEKVVICGSSCKPFGAKIALSLASSHCKKYDRDSYRDNTMNKLMFGSYNKKIKNPKTEFDWLSTNDESNKKYIEDFRCGYVCTPGFYYEFIKGLNRIHEDENVKRIPSNLPIFLIAGSDDPVGSYGKGVIKKYNQYKKLNKKVNIKLYEGMRHEILNEIGREEVYNDVLNFYNE